jgi:phosphate transport system substrate-binding protein
VQFFRGRLFMLMSLLALLAFATAFAACGDDDDDGDDGGNEATATDGAEETPGDGGDGGDFDYGSLSGEINVDGSSTVYPISAAMAEDFAGVAPDVQVNVAQSGTGGGFELFCADEIEVSDASRPIDAEEIQLCADGGIPEDDIVELQVGIDALTVVVHPDNDFVTCLTTQQLFDIFTGAATNWSEVDPSFPDEDIGDSLYYPGADSGTFDFFVEQIITEIDEAGTHTGSGTSSEDDNVLVTGIEGDSNAIGYFGFAYYQQAGQNLKAVEIDAGDGCVAPSSETALDGSYYLSRPLFIYTRETFLNDASSPVLGFVNFYLENIPTIVPEVGYVELPDDLFAEQEAKIEPFLP